MRLNMLIIGLVLCVSGLTFIGLMITTGTFAFSVFGSGWFTTIFGLSTLSLAVATSKSPGVLAHDAANGDLRLLVDKGVVRTTIYQLMFLPSKVAMKKLASVNVTVFLSLALAVFGYVVEGLIGVLAGGLTGYCVQEYLTQRNRDRIGKNLMDSSLRREDRELEYDDIDKVRLRGSSITFFLASQVVRVSLPRGYADRMRSSVESLFGDRYEEASIQ